jgi:diguanylate cyclase (GGDEF)-like protein
LISLKKFLDQDTPIPPGEKDGDVTPLSATDCYRAALLAVGRSAVDGCPALGLELERSLQALERRLSSDASDAAVQRTEKQVEIHLQEWGARTAEHFKIRANEVKELLIALARTAESVGDRTEVHAVRFRELTSRLESIANLDDLTQIRTSLMSRVNELKDSVSRMARDNAHMVSQLQAEVSRYETRLKEVESLILKDELTGVANRRSIEERIRWNIAHHRTFCVVMLDLNGFKQINDIYGHPAGDDLLRQFAAELRSVTKAGDLVGRWGGDEFVALLSCDALGAVTHMNRIREWVFGKYTLRAGNRQGSLEISMEAAMGLAEWGEGKSEDQIIADADKAMYREKKNLACANK